MSLKGSSSSQANVEPPGWNPRDEGENEQPSRRSSAGQPQEVTLGSRPLKYRLESSYKVVKVVILGLTFGCHEPRPLSVPGDIRGLKPCNLH